MMGLEMTLPTTIYAIWWTALLVVLLVIVPLALALLQRTLKAAWAIRRYIADMLAAGAAIAESTGSLAALEGVTTVAGGMVDSGKSLRSRSAAIAEVLVARATAETAS